MSLFLPLLPPCRVMQQLVEELDGSQMAPNGHGFVHRVRVPEVVFSIQRSRRRDVKGSCSLTDRSRSKPVQVSSQVPVSSGVCISDKVSGSTGSVEGYTPVLANIYIAKYQHCV